MSWVTNVMLSVGAFEPAVLIEEFSEWLRTEAPRREQPDARGVGYLSSLSDEGQHWGGWKNPECRLFGGALNHADLPAVIEKFASFPWREPGSVQLMVNDQEQCIFRVWMIRDEAPVQVVPVKDYGADD